MPQIKNLERPEKIPQKGMTKEGRVMRRKAPIKRFILNIERVAAGRLCSFTNFKIKGMNFRTFLLIFS